MIRILRLLFLGLAAFALASLLMGCPNTKLADNLSTAVNFTDAEFEKLRGDVLKNSVNIQVDHPLGKQAIQQAFHNQFPQLPLDSIHVRSCPCDSTLLNITLPHNWTIEGQDGKLAVSPPGSGAAEGAVAIPGLTLVGLNYPVSAFDDSQLDLQSDLDSSPQNLADNIKIGNEAGGHSIKIAVFDSGLRGGYIPSALVANPTYRCNEDKLIDTTKHSAEGWNFVDDKQSITNSTDISTPAHGSRVSYFLAKQFNGSSTTPLIVPMRVLGADNTGDLFGLLCAMETARLNGVKVFNMSLGYYGAADSLLKTYITRAVHDNIWIVAAAGNCRPYEPLTINRDLTTMSPKFYPAAFSLSQGFDKLLVVTTVLTPSGHVQASIRQNYGQSIVLGVRADVDLNGNGEGRFLLAAPAEIKNKVALFVFGNSYATPILTGRLARLLSENPTTLTSANALLPFMNQGNSSAQIKGNRYFSSSPLTP